MPLVTQAARRGVPTRSHDPFLAIQDVASRMGPRRLVGLVKLVLTLQDALTGGDTLGTWPTRLNSSGRMEVPLGTTGVRLKLFKRLAQWSIGPTEKPHSVN